MAGDFPIIRIMPNIPASVGEGMILYCSHKASKTDIDAFLKAMSKAGKLSAIDEKLIDAGSAVSGCGPAYAFMFIEALADGGVECGPPKGSGSASGSPDTAWCRQDGDGDWQASWRAQGCSPASCLLMSSVDKWAVGGSLPCIKDTYSFGCINLVA